MEPLITVTPRKQAQNLVMPVMKVTLLGVLANVFFHHVTMVVLGMGVYGAGLALSFTGMFLLAALIAYTWIFRCVRGCFVFIGLSKRRWEPPDF